MFLCCFISLLHASDASEIQFDEYESQAAICQYKITNEENQAKCFEDLIKQLEPMSLKEFSNLELKTLLAINYVSLAGVTGSAEALSLIRKAKELLEVVVSRDPTVVRGTPYVILATLYYRAPSWPISFGNNQKAKEFFDKANQQNHDSLVTDYFYADYLIKTGHKKEAIQVLKKALTYEINPKYELADQGRKQDIENLLQKLNKNG